MRRSIGGSAQPKQLSADTCAGLSDPALHLHTNVPSTVVGSGKTIEQFDEQQAFARCQRLGVEMSAQTDRQ